MRPFWRTPEFDARTVRCQESLEVNQNEARKDPQIIENETLGAFGLPLEQQPVIGAQQGDRGNLEKMLFWSHLVELGRFF